MPFNVKFFKKEKGITGLETAIVLIAFVIVASVLSYVVISAGLFSSQKAKAAVNSGLAQSGQTIEMKGNVTAELGLDTDNNSLLTKIYMTIGVVPGGSPIDLTPNQEPPVDPSAPASKVVISYSDDRQQVPALYWDIEMINANNGDLMLDPGELCLLTVYTDATQAYYSDADDHIHYIPFKITPGTTFYIAITPPDGSIMPVERLLPAGVQVKAGQTSALVNLY
jgi:flagellin FlaB